MGKIIERHITNEDGDFYGIVGNITRLGAYRAIRQDLEEYGILEDIDFTADDLGMYNFVQTTKCIHGGEHEDWIWWSGHTQGDETKPLGVGWGFYP